MSEIGNGEWWIYANLLGPNGTVLRWYECNFERSNLWWNGDDWQPVYEMQRRLMETVNKNERKKVDNI